MTASLGQLATFGQSKALASLENICQSRNDQPANEVFTNRTFKAVSTKLASSNVISKSESISQLIKYLTVTTIEPTQTLLASLESWCKDYWPVKTFKPIQTVLASEESISWSKD